MSESARNRRSVRVNVNCRQLVDSVPGMIAVGDSTGELEYPNQRFLDFLGMTIEELSGSYRSPFIRTIAR
jgi:PAS domain-containing protein